MAHAVVRGAAGLPKAFPLVTIEKRGTPQRKKSISFGDPKRAIPRAFHGVVKGPFMIRMGARPIKTFGDPHRDGPLGIPKGNRLFQRKSTISRLSMFRAAACADAGGESNYYIDGTRRGAWSGRAPQSISTGDVRKKGDSPKEKVDFLQVGDPQRAIPLGSPRLARRHTIGLQLVAP